MNTGTFSSMPGEPIGMSLSRHTLVDRQLTGLAALVFGKTAAFSLELQRINLQVPAQL